MQLILTQTDIEAALINYVNEILTVREGSNISVDLRATRGADGATAIIDISPASKEAKAVEVEKQPATVVTKAEPKPVKTTPIKAKPEPVEKDLPLTDDEKNAHEQALDSEASDESNEAAQEAADPTPADPEPEEEAPAPAKSLFAGLRKPKND